MMLREWIYKNRTVFTERDSKFLLKYLLGKDNTKSILYDHYLNTYQINYLEDLKRLHTRGLPLAYLVGKEEFFSLTFLVNEKAFIPRPETEIIVEKALEIIDKEKISFILDLCCGTSCIAIAIDKHRNKNLHIFASDISKEALKISRKNIRLHSSSVYLVQTDLFSGFKEKAFDLIISNPPYVERRFIKGSLEYEPRISLEAGHSGLHFIEKILNWAHLYLKKNGYLIIEMGYNHSCGVNSIIQKLGFYDIIEWIKDYSSHYRGIIIKKK